MNCKILFIGSEFIFSQRAIVRRGDIINSDPFNTLNFLSHKQVFHQIRRQPRYMLFPVVFKIQKFLFFRQ